MLRITVYEREDCHLCEALRFELLAFREATPVPFEVDWVDVDGDASLARRYGHKVPVVTLGRSQVCHYFFDAEALKLALRNHPCAPAAQ